MSRMVQITCDAPAFEAGQFIGYCARRTFGRDVADAEARALADGWTVNPDRCWLCQAGGPTGGGGRRRKVVVDETTRRGLSAA